jgi:hypothetical protein
MYGLVNKAIHDMVVSSFDEATWNRIRAGAGVDDETFLSMESYPDDVTYRLVRSASELLGTPADGLLEAFGEFWTRFTAEEGYGDLMTATGGTVAEFLGNLDNLHSRVGLVCPHLRPPSFSCTDVTPDSLTLHYYTDRDGLAPMVIGLLKGVGARLGASIAVERTRRREDGAGHDEFHVRFHDVAC